MAARHQKQSESLSAAWAPCKHWFQVPEGTTTFNEDDDTFTVELLPHVARCLGCTASGTALVIGPGDINANSTFEASGRKFAKIDSVSVEGTEIPVGHESYQVTEIYLVAGAVHVGEFIAVLATEEGTEGSTSATGIYAGY